MKIAVLDFVFAKGHKNFNSKIIEILNEFSDLLIFTIGKKEKKNNNLYFKIPNLLKYSKNPFLARIIRLVYMFIERVKLINVNPEKIVVFGFDTLVYAIGRFLYFNKESDIYLFHHENIDELSNKIKLIFFKTYMNKVNHIVLSDYFKEYLVNDIGVQKDKVLVMPHPLPNVKPITEEIDSENGKKIFVGISQSNDEELIKNIISFEKRNKILKKNNCKLILKSEIHSFENDNLIVFNEYLSDDEYNYWFRKATAIVILFSKSYKYRMSGTFIDAFSRGKAILANDIKLIQYFKTMYPDSCYMFSNINELFNFMAHEKIQINEDEIDYFIKTHSDNNIKNKLLEFLKD